MRAICPTYSIFRNSDWHTSVALQAVQCSATRICMLTHPLYLQTKVCALNERDAGLIILIINFGVWNKRKCHHSCVISRTETEKQRLSWCVKRLSCDATAGDVRRLLCAWRKPSIVPMTHVTTARKWGRQEDFMYNYISVFQQNWQTDSVWTPPPPAPKQTSETRTLIKIFRIFWDRSVVFMKPLGVSVEFSSSFTFIFQPVS
jgi:hypothetical protein